MGQILISPKVIMRVSVDTWELKLKKGSSRGSGILYTPSFIIGTFKVCNVQDEKSAHRIQD
jgi:hypothetical protein